MTFKSVKDHGDQKRWHRNWLWGVFLWGSVLMTGANTDENCSFAWPATLWRGLLLGLCIGLLSLVFQLQCHKDPLRPLLCSSVTGTQHVLKKCLLSKWTISYQTEGLEDQQPAFFILCFGDAEALGVGNGQIDINQNTFLTERSCWRRWSSYLAACWNLPGAFPTVAGKEPPPRDSDTVTPRSLSILEPMWSHEV